MDSKLIPSSLLLSHHLGIISCATINCVFSLIIIFSRSLFITSASFSIIPSDIVADNNKVWTLDIFRKQFSNSMFCIMVCISSIISSAFSGNSVSINPLCIAPEGVNIIVRSSCFLSLSLSKIILTFPSINRFKMALISKANTLLGIIYTRIDFGSFIKNAIIYPNAIIVFPEDVGADTITFAFFRNAKNIFFCQSSILNGMMESAIGAMGIPPHNCWNRATLITSFSVSNSPIFSLIIAPLLFHPRKKFTILLATFSSFIFLEGNTPLSRASFSNRHPSMHVFK